MFGCCGFLSFSLVLVLCRFGGRLETTLYIHFTRRQVKARRHFSASRESKREKKGGKERHSLQLAVLWGVCGVYLQTRQVDGLSLAWASPLPRNAYTASLTAARCHVSVPGVGEKHTLVGCSPGPGFRFDYDRARRAWVFYSGICYATWRGFYNTFGITARWQPRIFGEYRAEVTACAHELFTSCSSRSATLVVLWRWRSR